MNMTLGGKEYTFQEVYGTDKLVDNCTVVRSHKIVNPLKKKPSHGEAKLYIGTQSKVEEFFGELPLKLTCFFLKADLFEYLAEVKSEYEHPSQNYYRKDEMPEEWRSIMQSLLNLDDTLYFSLEDLNLTHQGIYVNSNDSNYQLFREMCLPCISYMRIMRVCDSDGNVLFYFQPKADIGSIMQKKALSQLNNYGLKKNLQKNKKKKKIKKENADARDGQGKYRKEVLSQCIFCPVTKISDERLLIASHIKPWALCDESEQIDPNNGFILSPLIDKLFDKGFLTFTDDKKIKLSRWISPETWNRTGLKEGQLINELPLNANRLEYLKFHQLYIFEQDCPYLKKKV